RATSRCRSSRTCRDLLSVCDARVQGPRTSEQRAPAPSDLDFCPFSSSVPVRSTVTSGRCGAAESPALIRRHVTSRFLWRTDRQTMSPSAEINCDLVGEQIHHGRHPISHRESWTEARGSHREAKTFAGGG